MARYPRNKSAASMLTAGLLACGACLTTAGPPVESIPTVTASNAWIRWLPADLPAAGYVTLRNNGNQPLTLIKASTPDYGLTMFHASRTQQGVEQMVPVDSVHVAPHSQLSFAPEGLHIMLTQPTRAIQPGDYVILTLHFANGQSLQARFEVRGADGSVVKRTTGVTGG
jgi:copper(I)-binding protein